MSEQLELVEGLLPHTSGKVREVANVNPDLVLVVPETNIEKVKADSAYVCQNQRIFKSTQYIAFYHKNAIIAMAEIVSIEDDVDMTDPSAIITDPTNRYLHLTDVDKFRTVVHLANFREINIQNNLTSPKSGKRVAFVQGQRYVSYAKLTQATTTSELL